MSGFELKNAANGHLKMASSRSGAKMEARQSGVTTMSIILELREHISHAGLPLVHQGSEDVLLSNVFGVVKNLPTQHVLAPWLSAVTGCSITALIYVTPDTAEPPLVNSIRAGDGPFPVNPGTSPSAITSHLHWGSWGSVGDVLAAAYSAGAFSESESGFARDLLATSRKSDSGRIASATKQVFIPTSSTAASSSTHPHSCRTRSNDRNDTAIGATNHGTKRDLPPCCRACGLRTRHS